MKRGGSTHTAGFKSENNPNRAGCFNKKNVGEGKCIQKNQNEAGVLFVCSNGQGKTKGVHAREGFVLKPLLDGALGV